MSNNNSAEEYIATRNAIGDELYVQMKLNSNIFALSADLIDSTKLTKINDEFSDRVINVGVAETSLVQIASGLEQVGFIPVITSFAAFSPGRNWDFIRTSVCYSNRNIKIFSTHVGLGVGEDGATHQAMEDIAIMRVIPNLVVLNPCDYYEAKNAIKYALSIDSPVYIRFTRQPVKSYCFNNIEFTKSIEIKRNNSIDKNVKISILSTGCMLETAEYLYENIQKNNSRFTCSSLNNFGSIKPIDEKKILELKHESDIFITLEDTQLFGGFGSSVLEVICESHIPVIRIGMEDSFGESGDYLSLFAKYRLDNEGVLKRVLDKLKSQLIS